MQLLTITSGPLPFVFALLTTFRPTAPAAQRPDARAGREPAITTVHTSEPLASNGRLGGVAVDAAGNVYVANFSASVWRVAPDGTVTTLSTALRGSSGNAIDADGNLLQASFVDGRILRIAPDGTATDLVSGGLDGPVGLATDDDGSVYVCNCRGNTISRVSRAGAVTEFARNPDFDCPNGIVSGPDGVLYVVSFKNGHIVRIAPDGSTERFATVPDGKNAHIAFARGALWVTKIEANRLYRVTMDGEASRYAGTGETGFDDGPVAEAPLARPNGIAVLPGGDAVVVNTLDGEWHGDVETRIVLRRVGLPDLANAAERIRIPVRDKVFDALAEGPADGELVLLLHGFPETGIEFDAQLHALAAAGYRAVAPDQRGYSPDARPSDPGEYAMGYLVGDVLGIADALGHERFHLVGHDWGGAVAWVAATREPDRVRTLTVLSTPHFAALGAQLADTASDQAQRSSYFNDFSAPDAATRFLADDMAILRQLLANVPAAHRAVYLERLGTPEALGAALDWYRASGIRPGTGGGGAAAGGSAAAPAVSPVTVPTLYVWGADDGVFGRAAVERTATFVSGPYEFHALEGIGHWVPELAADTVNALLLRHLRSTGSPARR